MRPNVGGIVRSATAVEGGAWTEAAGGAGARLLGVGLGVRVAVPEHQGGEGTAAVQAHVHRLRHLRGPRPPG